MFWKKFADLSDDELFRAADHWAANERKDTIELLGILIAMDDRDLPTRRGHPGLFRFCTDRLKFSQATAYWRIRTARAARKHPQIAEKLLSGEVNITTVTILASYLTEDNADALIAEACGKTRQELEAYLASLAPSAPRRDVVTRQGPTIVAKSHWPPTTGAAMQPGASPGAEQKALDIIEALDAERRRLHFDVGPDTAELIERARQILRHKYPFTSLEDVVREALNVLLNDKDLERNLENGRARPADGAGTGVESEPSRSIPMWVRREVWKRDGGRCAYVGDGGVCCEERSWLEFDHVVPFAKGGRSDDPANIRLLCRAHNQLEARRLFGPLGPGPAPGAAGHA